VSFYSGIFIFLANSVPKGEKREIETFGRID